MRTDEKHNHLSKQLRKAGETPKYASSKIPTECEDNPLFLDDVENLFTVLLLTWIIA